MSKDEMTAALQALEERIAARLDGASGAPRQEYFTKSEAAEYLRVSRATLDRARQSGKLRYGRTGEGEQSGVIFRRCDLDAWAASRMTMDQTDIKAKVRRLNVPR